MTTTLCGFCGESVEGVDESPIEGAQPLHRECGIRLVVGSVAHLERRCSCYVRDSDESDPPWMTLREAARAAARLYLLNQVRN